MLTAVSLVCANTVFLGQAGEAGPESLSGQSWFRENNLSSEFQCPKFNWVWEGIFLLVALGFLHLKSVEDRAPGVEDQVEQCIVMCLHCAGSTPTWL